MPTMKLLSPNQAKALGFFSNIYKEKTIDPTVHALFS